LPDGRGKHNEDSDDVNRSSSDSKRKWDEDDTSDGQGCHIGSIGVIEIGIADPEFFVEDLPEWNRDAKTVIPEKSMLAWRFFDVLKLFPACCWEGGKDWKGETKVASYVAKTINA